MKRFENIGLFLKNKDWRSKDKIGEGDAKMITNAINWFNRLSSDYEEHWITLQNDLSRYGRTSTFDERGVDGYLHRKMYKALLDLGCIKRSGKYAIKVKNTTPRAVIYYIERNYKAGKEPHNA
jgi:hypothetical protein